MSESTQKLNATPWHTNLFIGFSIGVTDVCVNHPLWVIKTRQQLRLTFSLNPRIIYQGVFAHAFTSVPMDMLQTSISRVVTERFFKKETQYEVKRVIGGFVGGVAAAFISAPTEFYLTRQQQKIDPIASLKKTPFKGWLGTAVRDGIFCFGFFSAVPMLKHTLEERKIHSVFATVIAGLVSGGITAIVSHPADTVKTLMQASIQPISYKEVCFQILKKSGVKGFFSGVALRTARVSSGILVLGGMNDFLEQKLIYKDK